MQAKTGGGAAVGGNVETGNDMIGRDDHQQSINLSVGNSISRDEYVVLLAEMAETRRALSEIAQLKNALVGNRDYGLVGVTGRLNAMNEEQEHVHVWLIWLTVAVIITILLQLAQWAYLIFV